MITTQIEERERGFEFGTYTFKIISQISGINTVEDVFDALKNNSLQFLPVFYFACAKHYCLIKKIQVDFDEVDVAGWIDEMGVIEGQRIIQELIKTFTTKNSKAPAMGLVEQQ